MPIVKLQSRGARNGVLNCALRSGAILHSEFEMPQPTGPFDYFWAPW